jgi:DNA processing protein
MKARFIQRNRIIAAMSKYLLVISAGAGSGTKHTVDYAIASGTEVMAVPGSPYDENCIMTNELIKNGAHVISNIQDILDITEVFSCDGIEKSDNYTKNTNKNKKIINYDNPEDIILSKLNYTPIDMDILLDNCENDDNLKRFGINFSNFMIKLEIEEKVIISGGKIFLKIQL